MNAVGRAYLGLGNVDAMEIIINNAIAAHPNDPEIYYTVATCLYSLANDEQRALKWLEQAIQSGYDNFVGIQIDLDLDNIRNSAGFKALMKKYFLERGND